MYFNWTLVLAHLKKTQQVKKDLLLNGITARVGSFPAAMQWGAVGTQWRHTWRQRIPGKFLHSLSFRLLYKALVRGFHHKKHRAASFCPRKSQTFLAFAKTLILTYCYPTKRGRKAFTTKTHTHIICFAMSTKTHNSLTFICISLS